MKNKNEKRFILSDGMFFNENGKAEVPKITYRKETPKKVEHEEVKKVEKFNDEVDEAYLTDESDQFGGYKITGREGRQLRRIGIMEQAMKRVRKFINKSFFQITFDFYSKSFVIKKGEHCPQVRYVYINSDGEYAFADDVNDLVYDKRIAVIEKAVKEFLNF